MAIDDRAHHQRERAESFGSVAGEYHRYRPGYPRELVADLVALRPASVLDIGCGTGKAALLLAASGLRVFGVEVDPRMAEVARAHGLDVEVGSFEQWDGRGRTFDLITCAQAWHWVDPAAGIPKAARLLAPGGTVALFWNYDEPDSDTRAVLDGVYERAAPGLRASFATGARRRAHREYAGDLRASGSFGDVTTRTYSWQRAVPLEQWLGRFGTHSDHLALGPRRLDTVLRELRAALGGREITLTGGTYVILARAGV